MWKAMFFTNLPKSILLRFFSVSSSVEETFFEVKDLCFFQDLIEFVCYSRLPIYVFFAL